MQATNRYRGGLASYLEVTSAQNAALANQRTAVAILTRRMTASVLLMKGLGGGWRRTELYREAPRSQAARPGSRDRLRPPASRTSASDPSASGASARGSARSPARSSGIVTSRQLRQMWPLREHDPQRQR